VEFVSASVCKRCGHDLDFTGIKFWILTEMQIFSFTPQETKALIFLVAALLVGSGITLYKKTHTQFASELVPLGREAVVSPNDMKQSSLVPDAKLLNINSATAEELQLLPGLGPNLSRRVVEYREVHGGYSKIEDIMQVNGIGPKTFQRIKEYISVDADAVGSPR
jgi:comEA protein